MPRRKTTFDKSELVTLPLLMEQLSLNMLLNRVIKEPNQRKGRSLEQKIIALKILQLNNMKYTLTAKQVGVDRKTLHAWWKQYGNMITQSRPEEQIAISVENDLAHLMGDIYASSRKVVKKIDVLVDKAESVRQLYPVIEALKAMGEFIKINREAAGSEKPRGSDYFLNFYTNLIQNKYGNKD